MLRDGDGKKLKPANLEPLDDGDGRVLCFWGDAQWSRTQLLGEIARGHWGLCRASVAELIAQPGGRRAGLEGRLVYSPETEMTEDFMRHGARQMEREARWQDRAGAAAEEAEEEEEEEEEEAMQQPLLPPSHEAEERAQEQAQEQGQPEPEQHDEGNVDGGDGDGI